MYNVVHTGWQQRNESVDNEDEDNECDEDRQQPTLPPSSNSSNVLATDGVGCLAQSF